jgi:hypothetical protein
MRTLLYFMIRNKLDESSVHTGKVFQLLLGGVVAQRIPGALSSSAWRVNKTHVEE